MTIDYSKGKVYKLVNDVDNEIYVGSTCQRLSKRKYQHVQKSKKANNRKVYEHLNKIGWEHVDIVLIENYECKNKEELHRREKYYIETIKATLNVVIPFRTKKQHYLDNKEKIHEDHKEYYEKHKEQRKAYNKQYIDEHKEETKRYQAKYRKGNTEKMKRYQTQYHVINKETINMQTKQYRESHSEEIKRRKSEWYLANKDKINEKRKLKYQQMKEQIEKLD